MQGEEGCGLSPVGCSTSWDPLGHHALILVHAVRQVLGSLKILLVPLGLVPSAAPCSKGVVCFVAKLCPTLCHPMDCNPPVSSVHGISQARILEWIAISSSRESFSPKDQAHISCIADGFFMAEPLGKPVFSKLSD